MIDLKNLTLLVDHIAQERGFSKEQVFEMVEQALASAYKKEYGKKGQVIKAKLDPKTGKAEFRQVKTVVDESMIYSAKELAELKQVQSQEAESARSAVTSGQSKVRFNPERHIMIEEARKLKPGVKPGEEVEIKLTSHTEYGRIAAQTAKQVILQKIREAERNLILTDFKSKEGQLVSGIVQRVEGGNVFVDLGKTLGVIPKEEQVPGEFYRPGQRLKLYCLSVQDSLRGPQVILSRAYPKLVSRLFELEVPEISAGSVEIKAIAREPGSRSKVAVISKAEGVDAVGSMVGQRGTRVSAVIGELGGEKIDIVEWAEDPQIYIANALSPAKVLQVEILPKNRAVATVNEDQLSLAIGRDGQNVRLAAKLTGWRIDVKTPERGETPTGEKEDVAENEKEI